MRAARTTLLLEYDWGWAQRGTKGSGGVNCTTCVCVGASCVARRSTPTPLPPPLSPYLHQGQPTAQDGRGNDQGAVVVAGQGGVGLGTALDSNTQCQQHEQGQGVPAHTKDPHKKHGKRFTLDPSHDQQRHPPRTACAGCRQQQRPEARRWWGEHVAVDPNQVDPPPTHTRTHSHTLTHTLLLLHV
jgi:hypothetical protein